MLKAGYYSIEYINPQVDGTDNVTIAISGDQIFFEDCNYNMGQYTLGPKKSFTPPSIWITTKTYCQDDIGKDIKHAFSTSKKVSVMKKKIKFKNENNEDQLILASQ